jgi:hypothetical protein
MQATIPLLLLCAACIYPDAPTPAAETGKPREVPPINLVPPRPQPEPIPPGHEPFERPPVADATLGGAWHIKEFSITVDPPTHAWLGSYDAAFGLSIEIGDRDPFGPPTQVEIGTNCDGRCVPSEFAERIQNRGADRIFKNVSGESKDVHWVVRPTQFEPNRWWMHLRGVGDDDRTVIERVEVDTIVPESKGGWFRCSASIRDPQFERLDELTEFCKTLVPKHVGEATEPLEARFEGKYPLGGVVLDVPTPEGLRFSNYSPRYSRLEFRSRQTMDLSSLTVSTGCQGSCESHKLEANLKEASAEKLAELKTEGRVFEVEQPLAEVTPGRWMRRLHFAKADRFVEAIHIDAYALRPGAERFLHCRVKLEAGNLGRVAEFEQLCREMLEPW